MHQDKHPVTGRKTIMFKHNINGMLYLLRETEENVGKVDTLDPIL